MSDEVTMRLVIRGRVQGVWYRESMRLEAERLGVRGWVANRTDGSVEAVVRGTPEQVEAITRWARRGPEQAEVTEVVAAEASGEFSGFEKRATF
ncbi:MAG TPA: acylphosphatase [Usitatibacter sp.]